MLRTMGILLSRVKEIPVSSQDGSFPRVNTSRTTAKTKIPTFRKVKSRRRSDRKMLSVADSFKGAKRKVIMALQEDV